MTRKFLFFLGVTLSVASAFILSFDRSDKVVVTDNKPALVLVQSTLEENPLLTYEVAAIYRDVVELKGETSAQFRSTFEIGDVTTNLLDLALLEAGLGEINYEIQKTGWAGIGLAPLSSVPAPANDARQHLLDEKKALVEEVKSSLDGSVAAKELSERATRAATQAANSRKFQVRLVVAGATVAPEGWVVPTVQTDGRWTSVWSISPEEGFSELAGHIETQWVDLDLDLPVNSPIKGVVAKGVGATFDVVFETYTPMINQFWATLGLLLGSLLTLPGILSFWLDVREARDQRAAAKEKREGSTGKLILPGDDQFRP